MRIKVRCGKWDDANKSFWGNPWDSEIGPGSDLRKVIFEHEYPNLNRFENTRVRVNIFNVNPVIQVNGIPDVLVVTYEIVEIN